MQLLPPQTKNNPTPPFSFSSSRPFSCLSPFLPHLSFAFFTYSHLPSFLPSALSRVKARSPCISTARTSEGIAPRRIRVCPLLFNVRASVSKKNGDLFGLRLVPREGLEPSRPCEQQILSLPCLPFHHQGNPFIYLLIPRFLKFFNSRNRVQKYTLFSIWQNFFLPIV